MSTNIKYWRKKAITATKQQYIADSWRPTNKATKGTPFALAVESVFKWLLGSLGSSLWNSNPSLLLPKATFEEGVGEEVLLSNCTDSLEQLLVSRGQGPGVSLGVKNHRLQVAKLEVFKAKFPSKFLAGSQPIHYLRE